MRIDTTTPMTKTEQAFVRGFMTRYRGLRDWEVLYVVRAMFARMQEVGRG